MNRFTAKLAFMLAALIAAGFLVFIVTSNFVKAALADERADVSRDALRLAVDYFPNSARLLARSAEAEMSELGGDLALAEQHAIRAVSLSPYNFNYRLALASIQEAKGDRAAAERELRAALALAPNDTSAHYRLANLLVRQGRLAESLGEFRITASVDNSLLRPALDLVWQASGGNFASVDAVAGSDAESRLTLAQSLLKQGRIPEATRVFDGIDANVRKALPGSAAFLSVLISKGEAKAARDLWLDIIGAGAQADAGISNSSFENRILKEFDHFDWMITQSDYARVSLDTATAHTGARSLRLDFTGRDTTRLDQEIKQLVVVRPGAKYRLACYVKSDGFVSPDGPRLVVTTTGQATWIAASDAIPSGTSDWTLYHLDFIAPEKSAVYLSVKRKPRFSYDEPTRGRLWFDDFKLIEQQ